MARGRKKVMLDKDALTAAVKEVENGRNPPTNLSDLYRAVSEKLVQQGMTEATPGAVLGRIQDYNIPLKTQPGRRFGRDNPDNEQEGIISSASPPRPQTTNDIDWSPFTKRGIEVNSLADIFTSPLKDDDTNCAIMSAIVEIRRTYGLPALSTEEFNRLKRERG